MPIRNRLVLILIFILIFLASSLRAQSITCSVSGQTPRQTAMFAKFLADVNTQRAAQNPPLAPLANFNAFCSDLMLNAFNSFVQNQEKIEAQKLADAKLLNGSGVATNARCSAYSLANGCTNAQIACAALSITCD